jgi:competence protein ComEC
VRQLFQQRARARLVPDASDETGALLMALVTGRREWLGLPARQALRWSGLAHLAVVSGLHVGLVVVGLSAVCALPLGRAHRTGQLLALGASAGALALLPATPPVRRAALALLITRAGLLSGRGARPGHALAGAALLLLLLWPELSVSWSFALTVSATASLLLAGRWRGWRRILITPLAPFLATWPLLVCMTGRLSPWGPVANALAAPAVPLALGGAWLRVLVPEALGIVGEIAGHVARLAGEWVLAVASAIATWPGSGAYAGAAGPAWAALALAVLACALGWRPGPIRVTAWIVTGACWLWPLAASSLPGALSGPELCVLDVGQGQAILLRGRDRAWLVDAASGFEARALAEGLSAAGVRRLDGVVLTHLDEDHAGGLLPVLAGARPGWVAAPASVRDADQARHLASLAAQRGIAWRWLTAGDRISGSNMEINVLWPEPGIIRHGNEGGLVMLARTGTLRSLILGDAPLGIEERLERAGRFTRAGVLVASHHGARGGTGALTLRAVSPAWVSVSCGENNRFGHPHPVVLQRIEASGAARWITARAGGACFRSLGSRPAHAVRPLEVPSRSPRGVGGIR